MGQELAQEPRCQTTLKSGKTGAKSGLGTLSLGTTTRRQGVEGLGLWMGVEQKTVRCVAGRELLLGGRGILEWDWIGGSSPGRNAEGERVRQRDSSVAFCYTKRR